MDFNLGKMTWALAIDASKFTSQVAGINATMLGLAQKTAGGAKAINLSLATTSTSVRDMRDKIRELHTEMKAGDAAQRSLELQAKSAAQRIVDMQTLASRAVKEHTDALETQAQIGKEIAAAEGKQATAEKQRDLSKIVDAKRLIDLKIALTLATQKLSTANAKYQAAISTAATTKGQYLQKAGVAAAARRFAADPTKVEAKARAAAENAAKIAAAAAEKQKQAVAAAAAALVPLQATFDAAQKTLETATGDAKKAAATASRQATMALEDQKTLFEEASAQLAALEVASKKAAAAAASPALSKQAQAAAAKAIADADKATAAPKIAAEKAAKAELRARASVGQRTAAVHAVRTEIGDINKGAKGDQKAVDDQIKILAKLKTAEADAAAVAADAAKKLGERTTAVVDAGVAETALAAKVVEATDKNKALAAQLKTVTDEVDKATAGTRKVNGFLKGVEEGAASFAEKFTTAQKNIDGFTQKIERFSRGMRGVPKDVARAQEEVYRLGAAITSQGSNIAKAQNAYEVYGKKIAATQQELVAAQLRYKEGQAETLVKAQQLVVLQADLEVAEKKHIANPSESTAARLQKLRLEIDKHQISMLKQVEAVKATARHNDTLKVSLAGLNVEQERSKNYIDQQKNRLAQQRSEMGFATTKLKELTQGWRDDSKAKKESIAAAKQQKAANDEESLSWANLLQKFWAWITRSGTARQANKDLAASVQTVTTKIDGAKSSLSGFSQFLVNTASVVAGQTIFTGLQNIGSAMKALPQQAYALTKDFETLTFSITSLLAKEFRDTNPLVGYKEAFAQMGPEADKIIAKLVELGNASTFTTQQETEVFQTLQRSFSSTLSMGITSVLSNWGDAMGKSADDLNGIAVAFGQMQTKGKVSLDDLNQASERGVTALDYLATGYGKTKAEIGDMISAGEILANDAIPMIVRAMSTDFKGAGDLAGQTLKGLESSLVDFKDRAIMTFFAPTMKIVGSVMKNLTNALTNPQVMGAIQRLGASFAQLISASHGMEVLRDGVNLLVAKLTDPAAIAAIQRFGEALIGIVGKGLTFISDLVPSVLSGVESLMPVFEDAFGFLAGIGTEAYTWGSDLINQFLDGILAGADGVSSVVQGIGDTLAYWMQPNSPPKMAPKIDVWGKQTSEQFFGGMTQADGTKAVQAVGAQVNDGLDPARDKSLDPARRVFANSMSAVYDKNPLTGLAESFDGAFNRLNDSLTALDGKGQTGSAEYTRIQAELDRVDTYMGEQNKRIMDEGRAGMYSPGGAFGADASFSAGGGTSAKTLTGLNETLDGAFNRLNDAVNGLRDGGYAGTAEYQQVVAQLNAVDTAIGEQNKKLSAKDSALTYSSSSGGSGLASSTGPGPLDQITDQTELLRSIGTTLLKMLDTMTAPMSGGGSSRGLGGASSTKALTSEEYRKKLESELSGSKSGSGSKKATEGIDKTTKAQIAYLKSVGKTDEAMQLLQEAQGTLTEGSAEYLAVGKQIVDMENAKTRAADAAQKKAAAAAASAQKKADAQAAAAEAAKLKHDVAVGTDAQDLKLYEAALAKEKKGSVKYYDLLTKIEKLKAKLNKGTGLGGADPWAFLNGGGNASDSSSTDAATKLVALDKQIADLRIARDKEKDKIKRAAIVEQILAAQAEQKRLQAAAATAATGDGNSTEFDRGRRRVGGVQDDSGPGADPTKASASPMERIQARMLQVRKKFDEFKAFLQPFVTWVKDNQASIGYFLTTIALSVATAWTKAKIVPIFQAIGRYLGIVSLSLKSLLTPLNLVRAAVILFSVAWTKNFYGVQDIFNKAFADLVPTLTAIRAAFDSILRGNDGIIGIFQRFIAQIPALQGLFLTVFERLGQAMTSWLDPLAATLQTKGVEAFNAFAAWIKNNGSPVVLDAMGVLWDDFQSWWRGQQPKTMVVGAIARLTAYIVSITQVLVVGIISILGATLVAYGPRLQRMLTRWGEFLVEWIPNALPNIVSAIGLFIEGVVLTLASGAIELARVLGTWTLKLIGWILPAIPQVIGRLGDFVFAAVAWLVGVGAPRLLAGLAEWVSTAFDALGTALPQFGVNIGKLLSRFFMEGVLLIGTTLASAGVWAPQAWTWLTTSLTPALGKAIIGAFKGLTGIAAGFVLGVIEPFVEAIKTGQAVEGFLKWAKSLGIDWVTQLVGGISFELPQFLNDLVTAFDMVNVSVKTFLGIGLTASERTGEFSRSLTGVSDGAKDIKGKIDGVIIALSSLTLAYTAVRAAQFLMSGGITSTIIPMLVSYGGELKTLALRIIGITTVTETFEAGAGLMGTTTTTVVGGLAKFSQGLWAGFQNVGKMTLALTTGGVPAMRALQASMSATELAAQAASMAMLTTTLVVGVLALAIGGIVWAWKDFRAKIEDGTKALLESREWWNASTRAMQLYAGATQDVQDATKGEMQALDDLRVSIENDLKAHADRVNMQRTLGYLSSATQADLDAEMGSINAKSDTLKVLTKVLTSSMLAQGRWNDLSIAGKAHTKDQMDAVAGLTAEIANEQKLIDEMRVARDSETGALIYSTEQVRINESALAKKRDKLLLMTDALDRSLTSEELVVKETERHTKALKDLEQQARIASDAIDNAMRDRSKTDSDFFATQEAATKEHEQAVAKIKEDSAVQLGQLQANLLAAKTTTEKAEAQKALDSFNADLAQRTQAEKNAFDDRATQAAIAYANQRREERKALGQSLIAFIESEKLRQLEMVTGNDKGSEVQRDGIRARSADLHDSVAGEYGIVEAMTAKAALNSENVFAQVIAGNGVAAADAVSKVKTLEEETAAAQARVDKLMKERTLKLWVESDGNLDIFKAKLDKLKEADIRIQVTAEMAVDAKSFANATEAASMASWRASERGTPAPSPAQYGPTAPDAAAKITTLKAEIDALRIARDNTRRGTPKWSEIVAKLTADINELAGLEGRAAGGPMRKGVPYIIGENGPEIMVPDQNGTVLPNRYVQALQGLGGGGVGALQGIAPRASLGLPAASAGQGRGMTVSMPISITGNTVRSDDDLAELSDRVTGKVIQTLNTLVLQGRR